MALNNLAGGIQNAIQTNMLQRVFEDSLRARLGFRAVAAREPFPANVGETITKTRPGLLPAMTTPLSAALNTDLTSGITPQNLNVEQYTLGVKMYGANTMLNQVTSKVAIASIFLQNADKLAEQAYRSVDTLAANALFSAGMSGGATTLSTGSATTLNVDSTAGIVPPMVITINGHAYNVTAVTNPVLTSSGLTAADFAAGNTVSGPGGFIATTVAGGSATALAVNGVSGFPSSYPYNVKINNNMYTVTALATPASLTTSGVVAGDFAAGQNVSAAGGSTIVRLGANPLTIATILGATNTLRSNNVPPDDAGFYTCYANPNHLTGLYQDPAFQSFQRGQINTSEYVKGVVAELLGVRIVYTNMGPNGTIGGIPNMNRAIVVGKDALVEGVFTGTGYAGIYGDDNVTMADGVAHVIREPLDALLQVVTQSWCYIGGFVAPTDNLTNSTTIPTANSAAYKRTVVIESQ
jgi:hypothetical protein